MDVYVWMYQRALLPVLSPLSAQQVGHRHSTEGVGLPFLFEIFTRHFEVQVFP